MGSKQREKFMSDDLQAAIAALQENMCSVVLGKPEVVRLCLVALLIVGITRASGENASMAVGTTAAIFAGFMTLLGPIMLLSLVTMATYFFRGRRSKFLVFSAVAAGFSWLTKSPSFILITFFGLLSLRELRNIVERLAIERSKLLFGAEHAGGADRHRLDRSVRSLHRLRHSPGDRLHRDRFAGRGLAENTIERSVVRR